MKNISCFLDFEFMTEKIIGSGQEMLSIGAVFLDTDSKEIIDTYYSLCKPEINTTISKFCTELTGLTQKMIDNAPSFYDTVHNFENIIRNFEKDNYTVNYYVWGNFDKINLRKIISYYDYHGLFKSIVLNLQDIQPKISKSIKFDNRILRKQWGLSNMRNIYKLNDHEHTEHNALSDAIALCDIYIAHELSYPINNDFLQEIALDDEQKKINRINSFKEKCLILYNEIENSSHKNISCETYGSLVSLYSRNLLERLNNYNINLEYYPWGIIVDIPSYKGRSYLNGKPYFTFNNLIVDISKDSLHADEKSSDELNLFITINISNMKKLNIKYKLPLNINTYKYAHKFIKSIDEQ